MSSIKGKIHTLYPRALSSLAEQGYRSMNLYLSTSRAVSLPSYSSLKAVNRLRSTFRILARSPMLLSKARNRAQISLKNERKAKINKHHQRYRSLHRVRTRTQLNQRLTLPWLFWWQASWGEDTFKQNPGVVVLWREKRRRKKRRKKIQGYTSIHLF